MSHSTHSASCCCFYHSHVFYFIFNFSILKQWNPISLLAPKSMTWKIPQNIHWVNCKQITTKCPDCSLSGLASERLSLFAFGSFPLTWRKKNDNTLKKITTSIWSETRTRSSCFISPRLSWIWQLTALIHVQSVDCRMFRIRGPWFKNINLKVNRVVSAV